MNRFIDLFLTYRNAWIAAALIALSCSIVAVYVVLRRVAFIGIATAQVAAAGVALALLLHFAPLPAAAVATLAGVGLFASFREPVRVTREALVGVAFAVASALSVLFVFRSSTELDHIEHVVYGSLLFTSPTQVLVLAGGAAVVLTIHALFAKEFVMVSFDPDTARTLGVRTRAFDLLLFGTIGVVIALSIGTAGSLLTFALLVIPPLTALVLADRLPAVFALSVLSALVAVLSGATAALLFDLPPSPAIVVSSACLLLAAFAARVRPMLGAITLAAMLAAVGGAAARHHAEPAPGAAPIARARLHVDVELAIHDGAVKHGEKLSVDWVARVQGAIPGQPHLLVNVGDAVAAAALEAGDKCSGRITIDTAGLAPGRYRLSGSVWTGSPLEPEQETTMLSNEECSVVERDVEVVP